MRFFGRRPIRKGALMRELRTQNVQPQLRDGVYKSAREQNGENCDSFSYDCEDRINRIKGSEKRIRIKTASRTNELNLSRSRGAGKSF